MEIAERLLVELVLTGRTLLGEIGGSDEAEEVMTLLEDVLAAIRSARDAL